MAGLIVLCSILVLFLIILSGRVKLIFDYNGSVSVKIKYLFITLVRIPSTKPKKRKKSKKKKKSDKNDAAAAENAGENAQPEDAQGDGSVEVEASAENSENTENTENAAENTEKDEKTDEKKPKLKKKLPCFDEWIALLRGAVYIIRKPLRRFFGRIAVKHFALSVECGGEDAAKAAIKFGAVSSAAGNVLGLMDSYLKLKPIDALNITVDFDDEKTYIDFYTEISLSVATVLAVPFSILGRAIKCFIADKLVRSAVKKLISKPKPPKEEKQTTAAAK